MKYSSDIDLMRQVNERLKSGKDLADIASELNFKYHTLYGRIKRAGYSIAATKRLVGTTSYAEP
jgi:hypothetical protein